MEDKSKLYVGGLPDSVNDDQLKELFTPFGEIVEAKVIMDRTSGQSKGFGFVTMKDEESAEKAIAGMNGKEVEGKTVIVNIARPMVPRDNR